MTTERPTTAPLTLRVANLEDAAQIRRLEEAHFGVTELLDDWRGLWLKIHSGRALADAGRSPGCSKIATAEW